MDAWILFTLFAAVMQTVRTAAQKKLSKDLSPMTTTFVRYLYGVPFVFIYLAFVKDDIALTDAFGAPRISSFIIYASLAGAAQIVATYWLIKVLQLRNFAIGTIFAKTEALQTALLGIVFFSAFLSMAGWFAIILGVIGITAISYPDHQQSIDWQSVKYGTLSGLGFGFFGATEPEGEGGGKLCKSSPKILKEHGRDVKTDRRVERTSSGPAPNERAASKTPSNVGRRRWSRRGCRRRRGGDAAGRGEDAGGSGRGCRRRAADRRNGCAWFDDEAGPRLRAERQL